MLRNFKFWREEMAPTINSSGDSGCCRIGIAILFGDKIKAFVESLFEPDPNLKNRWGVNL